MLVLSRNTGESIDLFVNGETCRILITSVRGDRVRIAFSAPGDWRIMRSELIPTEGVSPRKSCRSHVAARSDNPSILPDLRESAESAVPSGAAGVVPE
jgi:carbon storage regulator CsrA